MPGNLAPRQQEHLVHLACFMPFDKVAEMMEEILSVQINQETVRRLTEQVGSWMEAAQTAEVKADGELESEDEQPLQRCVFSADGAMISLLKKQWAETRTVVIGEPQEKWDADGEREIHVGHLSYFSRLADASTFTHLAEVELRRRKVAQVKEVSAVMDGADWCQAFTERHRPDAVRILDFPHAAEHITKLLEALAQAGMRFPPQMLDRCLHILKHRGPRPLLLMADRLGSDFTQQKGMQEHLDYLRKREALMQYPAFRRDDWPIGSGMVESANKNVVEARLKGAGMHWQRTHVNPMLALRNAVCNDRWQEMWQKALAHHRKFQALQRSARAEQRAQAFLAVCHSTSVESPSQSAAASQEVFPPSASQPTSKKLSPPVPVAIPPSSCPPSAQHKRLTPPNRVNSSPHTSGEVSQGTCLCGTPLVRERGYRPKRYYSDRCRVRACRKRQAQTKPFLGSSRVPASQLQKRGAVLRASRVRVAPQRSGGVRGETCLFCGTRLVQSMGGRMKEFCSGRCRQRAHRERHAHERDATLGGKS